MLRVQPCSLPTDALLQRYVGGGNHADCYCIEVDGAASHAAFVEAFYTTAVFRIERLILRLLVARPSTDAQARQLALGTLDSFAAWTVEARAANQLLLADFQGRTRSWLMVAHAAERRATRLYFGSAVIAPVDRSSGEARMGAAFRLLLGFHQLYSRVLLGAAAGRLARGAAGA